MCLAASKERGKNLSFLLFIPCAFPSHLVPVLVYATQCLWQEWQSATSKARFKKQWPPSWVSLTCSPCLSWFTCSGWSQQLWYEDTQAACREAAHVVRNQGLQHPGEWTWRGTLQPLLTVWWEPHERPWAMTTHINCPQFLNSETMWGICFNLLDFEVICYAVTDDWASKVAQ